MLYDHCHENFIHFFQCQYQALTSLPMPLILSLMMFFSDSSGLIFIQSSTLKNMVIEQNHMKVTFLVSSIRMTLYCACRRKTQDIFFDRDTFEYTEYVLYAKQNCSLYLVIFSIKASSHHCNILSLYCPGSNG